MSVWVNKGDIRIQMLLKQTGEFEWKKGDKNDKNWIVCFGCRPQGSVGAVGMGMSRKVWAVVLVCGGIAMLHQYNVVHYSWLNNDPPAASSQNGLPPGSQLQPPVDQLPLDSQLLNTFGKKNARLQSFFLRFSAVHYHSMLPWTSTYLVYLWVVSSNHLSNQSL